MFEKFLIALESIAASLAKIAAAGGSVGGSASSAPAKDKPAPAKDKPATYTPLHTKAEAHAAANEVKENKGVKVIKAIIAGLGYEKMADISKPEDLDKLYAEAKAALGEGDASGDEDGI